MTRQIITIEARLCDGCGRCVASCHEQAIGIRNGKAVLLKDAACDGLGNCLPLCPQGAISFEEREAEPFAPGPAQALPTWPIQIKLVADHAAFFDHADLLIAADCTAFAYPGFYPEFVRGRVVLIGCPKLDSMDYSVRLGRILAAHPVRSVTLVRMEVPCCGGLERALTQALEHAPVPVETRVVTVRINGTLGEDGG